MRSPHQDPVATIAVFTPTTPARLTFVERKKVNDKLVNALQTPGKQLVVYGHSGSGKSTLLVNKLQQLYEGHVTTRCMAGVTFEQLVLSAFDQIGDFYLEEHQTKGTRSAAASLAGEYLGIKASLETQQRVESSKKFKRVVPQQLTPEALGKFLGRAEYCWVLEDFHKIVPREKKKIAQLLKVFMDMADEYPNLKIIALGAVDTAREVIELDPEMRNRVAEVYVPLMTEDELERIVVTGERLLNFEMAPEVRRGIVGYSSGLAAVCHQLCLNICQAAEIFETSPTKAMITHDELARAIDQYLDDVSDTLKAVFDKAFRRKKAGKYDNCRIIVEALATCDPDGATHAEILAEIKRRHPEYPSGNLTQYLRELHTPERGELLRFDEASGKHSFAHPIFRVSVVVRIARDNHKKKAAAGEAFEGFDPKGAMQEELFARVLKWLTSGEDAPRGSRGVRRTRKWGSG